LVNKRSIPGPAGRLVEQHDAEGSVMDRALKRARTSPDGSRDNNSSSSSTTSSATTASASAEFLQGSWRAMLHDLAVMRRDEGEEARAIPLFRYSLAWIKKQNFSAKVPVLCVLVVSLRGTDGGDAYVRLRDPSGTMAGTMHRNAIEEWQGAISSGAALVLKDVSVFVPTPGAHYLNVTSGNIFAVFAHDARAPAEGDLSSDLLETSLRSALQAPTTSVSAPARGAATPVQTRVSAPQPTPAARAGPSHSPPPATTTRAPPPSAPPLSQISASEMEALLDGIDASAFDDDDIPCSFRPSSHPTTCTAQSSAPPMPSATTSTSNTTSTSTTSTSTASSSSTSSTASGNVDELLVDLDASFFD
jgi:hypothetical protein